jgi:callose synthase
MFSGVLLVLCRNPSLRVAYIDEVEERPKDKTQKVYYSVLVKAVNNLDQEIYRIRLPGPVKLGEGKPENQNHAIIFTRGEGLQAIDMNQVKFTSSSRFISALFFCFPSLVKKVAWGHKKDNMHPPFFFHFGMGQDNYLEEAFKMRNLLEEFHEPHGVRPPTILGVREHIFTGSVSSLAWFMSNQETSFVTIGQRVLASPLK